MSEFQPQKEPKRSPNTSSFSGGSSNNHSGSGGSSSSSSSNISKFILPGIGLLVGLAVLQGLASMFQSKPVSSSASLIELEQNASLSRRQMMKEAPRFGLQDVEAKESVVRIILKDNAGEDGDVITFSINGQPYSGTVPLTNAGTAFDVPLNPGLNLMAVYGTKDGLGGITFAADVIEGNKSTTTMTLMPFPEGETAQFYLIRR